jgi:mRNA interferase MazF
MNSSINTVIIAPMTSKGRHYPTRIPCYFQDKNGMVVLDQIRTVDKTRLINFLGIIDLDTPKKVISVLQEIFAE